MKRQEEKLKKMMGKKETNFSEKDTTTPTENAPINIDKENMQELEEIIDEAIEEVSEEELTIKEKVEENLNDIQEFEEIEEECQNCKRLQNIITKDNEQNLSIRSTLASIRHDIQSTRSDVQNSEAFSNAQHKETQRGNAILIKGQGKYNMAVLSIVAVTCIVLGAVLWENKSDIKQYGKPLADLIGFANKAKIGGE